MQDSLPLGLTGILSAILVFIMPASVGAQDQRPAYQPLRYDEDWSALSDTSRRKDCLDSLKYISLGQSRWYVTLGGEIRERYELLDQPGFGTGKPDSRGYLLQRYLFSSDFHFGPRFRFFAEMQSAFEEGRTGGPRTTDYDPLEVHQTFVDWKIQDSGNEGVTLRVGRQEVGFGSGRLIAPAEGLNLRRSMDGARIAVRKGRLEWNTVALRLVSASQSVFGDVPDHTQSFWATGFVLPRPFRQVANIGAYYLVFDRKDAVFAKGMGREIRETTGVHAWKYRSEGWDYDDEGLVQWGSFRGAPIRAWALSENIGYTFGGAPLHPRIGLRSDATSGDHGTKNRALGSFDPLFPAVPLYSGPAALLGATNLIDVTPSLGLRFSKSVGLALESARFWRESLADSVYSPFNTPIRPADPAAGRYVASAPSATISWKATQHVSYTAIYSRFWTGTYFMRELPVRNVNYFTIWASYRF